MNEEELREIERRFDINSGVHIRRWNKEMGAETIRDMAALIREVKRLRRLLADIYAHDETLEG